LLLPVIGFCKGKVTAIPEGPIKSPGGFQEFEEALDFETIGKVARMSALGTGCL